MAPTEVIDSAPLLAASPGKWYCAASSPARNWLLACRKHHQFKGYHGLPWFTMVYGLNDHLWLVNLWVYGFTMVYHGLHHGLPHYNIECRHIESWHRPVPIPGMLQTISQDQVYEVEQPTIHVAAWECTPHFCQFDDSIMCSFFCGLTIALSENPLLYR